MDGVDQWEEATERKGRLGTYVYVTGFAKRDLVAHFFKIELLLPLGRVGFELQNALHI